jgi:diaminopimelate epimerase
MKPIFFTKMEATGNDFLLFDNRSGMISDAFRNNDVQQFIKTIAHPHFGAGADGVIFLEGSRDFPFQMRYFNRDGSPASVCLNGARCVASFAYRLGIVREKGKFSSGDNPIGFFNKGNDVSIEVLSPIDLKLNFSFTVNRKKIHANFLKLGIPHCVVFVDSFDEIQIEKLGPAIRNHKKLKPEGVNVNFVKVDENAIYVRTYERGVESETLSCGSGVLASAYIASKLFIATESPIICKTRGGELKVVIKEKLYLEGPANYIYDGIYYLKK